MRGAADLVIAACALSASVDALQLHKRSDGPPRVVGFPLDRRNVPNPAARDRLRRRANTVRVALDNEETLYFANATLGTPPQQVRLHIDTGSSDLWVNTPESVLCAGRTNPCRSTGSYAANRSSTYSYLASDFNISYVDGSAAIGDYVTDTFTIGPATLKKLQFGIGYESSSPEGILGIGYTINEVQVGRARKAPYNNLPAQLVAEGFIRSNAYSLWLNDLDANTGSILFGGVDTAQYVGSLQSIPFQKENGRFQEFLVTLTSLNLGSKSIAKNVAQAVLLDSGSSLTYLPNAMAAAIFAEVNAEYVAREGAAFVPCALAQNKTTLDFTFTKPKITVAMDELVISVPSTSGKPLAFTDGTPACLFGIAPAGSGMAVLGDTFIRSAYLVYDLLNNEVSIAQTNFNTTQSNILEIGTGRDSVPDSTPVAAAAVATTGILRGGSSQNSASAGQAASATPRANSASSTTVGRWFEDGMLALWGAGMIFAAM